MGKKILLILGIIAGALLALVLCVVIYMELGLYKPATSDVELLGYYFSTDEPGFSNVEIIKSVGEGIRRIPRTLEFSVQMESYPQPVTCQGEIFFDMGDPMILNVRWRTLQCAGQHRYIELAQVAMHNGFEYSECHHEKISLLLARWVKLGLISIDDVIYPAVNDAVTPLVANPDLLTLQPARDAGLFDTSEIISRDDVKSETESEQDSSIILRCDGRVELFKINSGYIHSYTEFGGGDYLMPVNLEQYILEPVE